MNTINLQMPNWLHESLNKVAAEQNCSVSLFITLAVTEKITLLTSKEYFERKANAQLIKAAAPINREKFDRLLDKVADAEPEERDIK
ncbi:MAG: toxin-antitoxin system HicB family antitoxin [Candidatus Parabeggiatoa sp. nov. 1]|nr:MAG: toxin-antitoxin system HicB family antitoxin [Gammaproteobacteria bacterium]